MNILSKNILTPISAGGGSLGPQKLNVLICFILTFPIYLFNNKISKKKRKKNRGTPLFSPLKSEASQNYPPCKKLDLNIIKIDWAKPILRLKIYIEFVFESLRIFPAEESYYNLANF